MVYTENMLAKHFKVSVLSPYECEINNVPVKGRPSYVGAKAVAIRVSESRKEGFAAKVTVFVDGHFRKIQWRMLSDRGKA